MTLIIPCTNISLEPKLTFILDPADLVKHDGNIWGIFHSHPGDENPIPSKEDKVSAAFQEYKFLVGFSNKFFIYWLDQNLDALSLISLRKNTLLATIVHFTLHKYFNDTELRADFNTYYDLVHYLSAMHPRFKHYMDMVSCVESRILRFLRL